ncbi:MAG: hypothetical protein ACT4PL_13525 [Phycisphaerales bacterium]
MLRWTLLLVLGLALAGVGAAGAWYYNRTRALTFKQETPDDVLRAAVEMVKMGRADQLPTLIYAESMEMRAVLNRLGGLTGSLQGLAGTIAGRFPGEVARYKAEAEEAAKSEKTRSVVDSILQGQRPAALNGNPQEQQSAFEQAAVRIFADPFGWIESGSERLSTVEVDDERAAILFDGSPVAGVGLSMRKVAGRWFIEIPTNLPGVNRYMPQTKHEWAIVANLIKVLDNAVKDLDIEVRAGRVARMENLAEKVGEMAFAPAAMVAIVYAKEMDVRSRRERALGDYRKRQSAYLKERIAAGADEGTLRRVGEALAKVATEELDTIIRVDTAVVKGEGTKSLPKFEQMPTPTFEATVEQWTMNRGAKLLLAALPAEPELTATLDRLVAPKSSVNRRR